MFKQWAIQLMVLGVLVLGGSFTVASAADSQVSFSAGQFSYDASAGGKGRDVIVLKAPTSFGSCVKFQSAKIIYKKRRYGEARIINMPAPGCALDKQQCRLDVSWKHAPAGGLNYTVEVTVKTDGC
ncbi:MAG: hypothetical protein CR991_04965 [Proteobacteria bacterium]|nr:MAG: hypothetical protein CR991_04965 [Pseudomonadota bacterium]